MRSVASRVAYLLTIVAALVAVFVVGSARAASSSNTTAAPRAYTYDQLPHLSPATPGASSATPSHGRSGAAPAAATAGAFWPRAAIGFAAEAGGGADLLAAQADSLVSDDLTAAGRALQKHGGRPGSAFPSATGTPSAISDQAGGIVRDILGDQTRRVEFYYARLKTQVVDIYDSTGRGIRYTKQGDFVGFLEPPR